MRVVKKIPKDWRNNSNYTICSEVNYGKIICKCKLIDCIYMDEEFINKIKTYNYDENLLGIYEVGRYAWVLEDIEEIVPISVKGHLGIWDFFENKK